MTFWDFLSTQSATETLRLLEGVVGVVAAILSGAALRNISQVRKVLGGPIRRTLRQVLRETFRRGPRHGEGSSASVLDEPLTLEQKVDSLQRLTERLWVQQGLDARHIDERLDRVDPPTRRH